MHSLDNSLTCNFKYTHCTLDQWFPHRFLAHDGLLDLHDLRDLVHACPELLLLDALIDACQQVRVHVIPIIDSCNTKVDTGQHKLGQYLQCSVKDECLTATVARQTL